MQSYIWIQITFINIITKIYQFAILNYICIEVLVYYIIIKIYMHDVCHHLWRYKEINDNIIFCVKISPNLRSIKQIEAHNPDAK
jgi:hypothetical protein